ncbi:MAG: ComF family protein [Clostridia bacterium]|nr:ComF family protein [Clostridia bacterium]
MNLFHVIFGRCCILCGKTVDPKSSEICEECSAKIEKNYLRIPLSENRNRVSVYYYGEPIRRGFHHFKYGGKKDFGIYLGKKLAERYRQRGDLAHVVTCVPRAKDGKARIYNQSAVIAKAAAKALDLPFDPNLLEKRKGALTQPECPTPLAREENAKKSYRAGSSRRTLSGLRVLLIDDLCTTGATVRACGDVLRKRGAEEVLVYTAIYDRTESVPSLVANFDQIHVHDDFSDAEKYQNRKYRSKTHKTYR